MRFVLPCLPCPFCGVIGRLGPDSAYYFDHSKECWIGLQYGEMLNCASYEELNQWNARSERSVPQQADVATFLQQIAAKFREGKIHAFSQGLGLDSAYCDAAAIVVENIASRAHREGWIRTRPVDEGVIKSQSMESSSTANDIPDEVVDAAKEIARACLNTIRNTIAEEFPGVDLDTQKDFVKLVCRLMS